MENNLNAKPDVRANITLTGRDFVLSGYRPAHLIGEYLTTGVQQYFHVQKLERYKTAEGTITFISPEFYPNSLYEGMKIEFYEGSRVIGYAEILEIHNDILKEE